MEDDFMLREILAFTLASDFMWGLWSLVQVHISDINFGYLVSIMWLQLPVWNMLQ